MINLHLFSSLQFVTALISAIILYSIYFGSMILWVVWLKLFAHYTWHWVALLLFGAASIIWVPYYLKLEHILSYKPLLLAIFILWCACLYSTYFNQYIDYNRLAFSRLITEFALPFFLTSVFLLTLHAHSKEYNEDSVIIFHTIRLLSTGVGLSFYLILWHRRLIFYHDRLGSNLNAFSQQLSQFFYRSDSFKLSNNQTIHQLSNYLDRQATSLALADCFYFMTFILVLLFCFIISILVFKKRMYRFNKKEFVIENQH